MKIASFVRLAAVSTLALAGCGQPPEGGAPTTSTTTTPAAEELPPGPMTPETAPAAFKDREGRTWIKRGPIKTAGRAPSNPTPKFAIGPADDLESLPLEDFARAMRPRMKMGNVEYQLAWDDALLFAETLRGLRDQPSPGKGQPVGGVEVIRQEEKIFFGTDDRQNINHLAGQSPYNRIARMYYEPNEGQCTCFKMINNYSCVTSAHCLMDDAGNWYDSYTIQFAPGTKAPLHPLCWGATIPGGYPNHQLDYAVITLRGRYNANCSFPDYDVGFFQSESPPLASIPGTARSFTGWTASYPGEYLKPGWSYPTLAYQLRNDVQTRYNNIWYIFYPFDVSGGQSGGPVVLQGSGRAIGIHKGYPGSGSYAYGIRFWSTPTNFLSAYAGY